MEEDQNGRRPKLYTTNMEDDQNGRQPKSKTKKFFWHKKIKPPSIKKNVDTKKNIQRNKSR